MSEHPGCHGAPRSKRAAVLGQRVDELFQYGLAGLDDLRLAQGLHELLNDAREKVGR